MHVRGAVAGQPVSAYVRRSDHGLTHVELASIILAFLATAGDAPLRERVDQLLNQQDIPVSALQKTLRQYVAMMGDDDAAAPDTPASAAAATSHREALSKTKQVLEALAGMLD